jgi:hypothetical protein
VSPAAGMRVAALAGVALLGVTIALAFAHRTHGSTTLPPPAGDWSTALAAPYTPATKKDGCGVRVRGGTMGVAHPVLPCGVKLYLQFRGKDVLTQVIDRGHTTAGRQFELTPALARALHIEGLQPVQWRLAG